MGVREPVKRGVLAAAVALAAGVTGCDSSGTVTGITAGPDDRARFPGFDISVYPGDATLTSWRFPTSPYYWVGYYLAAPCHRDVTWMGRYARVRGLGWGSLIIYVGQQDWGRIPNEAVRLAVDLPDSGIGADRATRPSRDGTSRSSLPAAVTCSATLLTTSQGALEATDAVEKTASEGFPEGSTIYLDVEYVTSVAPALRDYLTAWVTGVLADGRFIPAIYAAKSNAPAIYPVVLAAFQAARRTDAPKFWIASTSGFTTDSHPTDVGLPYAAVWQGRLDVGESWGGISHTIDVNVAASPSPSAPAATVANIGSAARVATVAGAASISTP